MNEIFTIGGTVVAQPQKIQYHNRPSPGKTLAGSVVWQGDEAITVSYGALYDAEVATLYQMFDPTRPTVTLHYGHQSGTAITRSAIWEGIEVGGKIPNYTLDVSMKFSSLGTAQ